MRFLTMQQGKSSTPLLPHGNVRKPVPPRRRWPLAAASLCSVLLLIFFYTYIYCILAIVYNYLWWVLFSSTVRLAHPSAVTADAPAVVPKLIHQTWRDDAIPEKWKAASQSCIDAHPGYEYMLWTDAKAERLIEEKYPWFIETFRGYTHNIQRADALRYFVLHAYGGIYLDLDIECIKSLDFLRYFNFTAPKTYPVGVSNDILVSRPGDPFALALIRNLRSWDHWFFVKYATVMFSTGPMFVTVQYVLHGAKAEVAVLPAEIYGKYDKDHPEAAMHHLHGSSWHGGDARLVFWIEKYWVHILVVATFLFGGLAGWLHGRYSGQHARVIDGGGKGEATGGSGALDGGGGAVGGVGAGGVTQRREYPTGEQLKTRNLDEP